jgi:hypothetical protein
MAGFPGTPSDGDQADVNGITYTYDGTKTAWVRTTKTTTDLSANSLSLVSNSSSISTTSGALIVSGGIGVSGNLNVGENVRAAIMRTDTLQTVNNDALNILSNVAISRQLNANVVVASAITSNTINANVITVQGNVVLTATQSPYLGENSIIRTNATTIAANITIPSGTNGMSAGPITIASGVVVTVSGDWSIV